MWQHDVVTLCSRPSPTRAAKLHKVALGACSAKLQRPIMHAQWVATGLIVCVGAGHGRQSLLL